LGKNKSYPTLDLHGRKKDEVFDLIDRFLVQNQSRNKVYIMPGKGSGALMAEAKKYLKLGGYPWSFDVLPSGKKNTGRLIIHLD